MENMDVPALQKEITLRGRIIESLLNGNEQLRHKYALLVSFIQSKAETYSPSEKEMLEKIVGNPVDGNGKGITEGNYSLAEKKKGTTEYSYSVTEKVNTSPDLSYSLAEKGKGIIEHSYSAVGKMSTPPNIGYSLAEKVKGTTEYSYSVTEKVKGISNPPKTLPEKIDVAKHSLHALNQSVKAHTKHKGRKSTNRANTNLLIHIYNGGECGYPTLKKVMDLSTGGVGKRLMSLTKRGLIKRTGLQKLALTESALNLLRQSYGSSGK